MHTNQGSGLSSTVYCKNYENFVLELCSQHNILKTKIIIIDIMKSLAFILRWALIKGNLKPTDRQENGQCENTEQAQYLVLKSGIHDL